MPPVNEWSDLSSRLDTMDYLNRKTGSDLINNVYRSVSYTLDQDDKIIGMSRETFLAVVISVPIVIILLIILCCCWCCHCCCFTRNSQQVVVCPPNPNNTVVSVQGMPPHSQGYLALQPGFGSPPDRGFVNQLYLQRETSNDQQVERGRTGRQPDPLSCVLPLTAVHGGQPVSE